jgi:hypothetical protein
MFMKIFILTIRMFLNATCYHSLNPIISIKNSSCNSLSTFIHVYLHCLCHRGHQGCDHIAVRFTFTNANGTYCDKAESSNPGGHEVYTIKLYVIKFVNDL